MLVGNEYLPGLRQATPQSMSVAKKDLLDLSLIGPNAPGIWAIWSLMLTKKMDMFNLPNPKFFAGKELSLPSACDGCATPRSHLANEFQQIGRLNYYMSVTFFASAQTAFKQLIMIWFSDSGASFDGTDAAD